MNVEFIEYIDQELERRNWTRNELATRAGISASTLSLISNGARKPGYEACKKIAMALNLPEEMVYKWAGILNTKKGEVSPRMIELEYTARKLSDEKLSILIDIARVLDTGEERKDSNASDHRRKVTDP